MKEEINNPAHYQTPDGNQVIDLMRKLYGIEAVYHFCLLNAFKYRMRAGKKGDPSKDIEKAIWYENYMTDLQSHYVKSSGIFACWNHDPIMKKLEKIIRTLEQYNEWRRDNTSTSKMLNPKEVGQAIDEAVKILKTILQKWSSTV